MDDDARVRAALSGIDHDTGTGADTEGSELWARTRGRIAQRRRRARAAKAGALVTAAAVVAAAVAVARDDGRARVEVGGTPPVEVPAEILAVVGGDLVALSASDLSVVRSAARGADVGRVHEVSAGGRWVSVSVDSAQSPDDTCGAPKRDLMVTSGDGVLDRIVTTDGATAAVLSPDGRWVAYRLVECGRGPDIGVTALEPSGAKANYRLEPAPAPFLPAYDQAPLAWMPDSARLLVSYGGATFRLVDVPRGSTGDAIELPPGTVAAVFVGPDEIAAAYPDGDHARVGLHRISTGETNELFVLPGRVVTALSFDAPSRALLVTSTDATGAGLVQVRSLATDGDAGETRALGELPGLTAAIWPGSLPAIVVPSPATTVSTTSTAPPVDPVRPDGNVVVPAAPRFRPVVEAVTRFESVGLAVEIERLAPGADDTDEVIWQEPPAGTIRPPGSIVRLWTCGPGADCVVPPPAYADGYEPATDWRPVDLASAQWRAIRDLAAADQAGLRAAVLSTIRGGFQGPETVSVTYSSAFPDSATGAFWVQWRNSEDDSIDGQDLRWWVEHDTAGYRVVQGEVREVCNRGEAVTDLCP